MIPVTLFMIVYVANASPVVTSIGVFPNYADCRSAADEASYLQKQGTPAGVSFMCVLRPRDPVARQ
jgi:hypothetical protein